MKDFFGMKNKTRLFGAYLPIYFVITLAAVVLRTVACLTGFNYETGYFDSKIVISIADGLVIFGSLLLITYCFFGKKDIKLIPSFNTPETYIPTGLVGVSLIFLIKHLADVFVARLKSGESVEGFSLSRLGDFLPLILAVLGLLSLVHFILTALEVKVASALRANFGLFTVAFLAVYVVYLYFSTELPINAPNKIIDQMAILFSAVFFLYETRISIGREKWRQYVAFGFIASMLCAYSSLPSAVAYFARAEAIENAQLYISDSVYQTVFTFALFIFILSRLILLEWLTIDETCPIVDAMGAKADERAAAMAENEKDEDAGDREDSTEEADDNQISIEDISAESDADESEKHSNAEEQGGTKVINDNE